MEGWSLVLVAIVVAGFAAVSRRLEGTPLTGPIVFVTAGLLFGTEGLDWIKVSFGEEGFKALAEATLVVILFTDASRIDVRALRKQFGLPTRLLTIGLPLTMVAGAIAGAFVFPSLAWPELAVLAIVLAPTDAALGQAVVTDPSLPAKIRQALNVESGLNDGLCVPFLTIAIALAEANAGDITDAHAGQLVVEAIGWGVFGGVVAGVVGGVLLHTARRAGWISPHWIPIVPVLAAIAAFGIADALGGSGFIAAYVGGVAYGRITRRDGDTILFSEQVGDVLNAVTLIAFGAIALGGAWGDITMRDVVYAVLSLTVVRMVPVAISLIGTGAARPTVAFLGWFGPRGLASIVFGTIVIESADLPHTSTLVTTVTVTVAISVLVHGLSAAPLARRYAAWCKRAVARGDHPMETGPAPRQRWRLQPAVTPE